MEANFHIGKVTSVNYGTVVGILHANTAVAALSLYIDLINVTTTEYIVVKITNSFT